MDLMNTADVFYHGWDADVVRERRTGFDAEAPWEPTSSGFKAINQQQDQLLTPRSSAAVPVQQYQARRRATSQTKRSRNPTVAQYLGLGSSDEPIHLEKYAPLPDGPRTSAPKPARKRQKLRGNEKVTNHFPDDSNTTRTTASQRRVSESLHVVKPRSKAAAKSKSAAAQSTVHENDPILKAQQHDGGSQSLTPAHQTNDHHLSHGIAVERSIQPTDPWSQDTYYDPNTQHFEINEENNLVNVPNQPDTAHSPVRTSIFDDEDFDDDLNDDDLLELSSDFLDVSDSTHAQSSSPGKAQVAHPARQSERRPNSSAAAPILLEKDNSKRMAKKFVSPTTLTTRLLAATSDIDTAAARKPIARPPFPDPVRDRSPIIGLTSNTLLRTCFRIGEVINQAHQASKTGKHIAFELYARVLESERDDTSQRFTFCDLFHGKPPYLKAVYDAKKWKSVQLFNYDSKRLLQQGRISRCMGTMKRDGKEWTMTLLNIWEATFDDISWVKGILDS